MESTFTSKTGKSTPVTGNVMIVLRLEGFFVFISTLLYYHQIDHPWSLFFLLFLLPDLGMLGYLWGRKVGAILYNTTHSYVGPLGLLGILHVTSHGEWNHIAIIWIAHIGFDRALGYGLKYSEGFKSTHLGIINMMMREPKKP